MNELDLPALDGANPLGFLAALGTLAVLSESDPTLKLGWRQRARWTPYLKSSSELSEETVIDELKKRLRKPEATSDSSTHFETDIGPLSQCTPDDFRALAVRATKCASLLNRRVPDMLIAFGIEKQEARKNAKGIQRTPFCFTTGSGHQEFISDARQLMTRKDPTKGDPTPEPCVTHDSIRAALIEHWKYRDPGLSLRWDPAEDIRRALQLEDPGPIGAHTVWMANLLAFRALVFFPCAEMNGRIATSAWCGSRRLDTFSWPLWREALPKSVVHSLISAADLCGQFVPEIRKHMRSRGVAAVFTCRRIEVGSGSNIKINFSQASGT